MGAPLSSDTLISDVFNSSQMKAQWEAWGGGVPPVILPSPYRSCLAPCLAYIGENRGKDRDGWVTVIRAEVIPARWWQNLLHNQRALSIRAALLFTPGVIVTGVRYHLEREREVPRWSTCS